MDEGRNMILLYPSLIDGIDTARGRDCFRAQCHMFYPERVVDIRDMLPKWKGLDGKSEPLDEDGRVVERTEGEQKKSEDDEKERSS
jgi:hypothetical protein